VQRNANRLCDQHVEAMLLCSRKQLPRHACDTRQPGKNGGLVADLVAKPVFLRFDGHLRTSLGAKGCKRVEKTTNNWPNVDNVLL
jgi:hypothetical protein